MKTNSIVKIPFFLAIAALGILVSCSSEKSKEEKSKTEKNMKVESKAFGNIDGQEVTLFMLENENGMKVDITNYGGIVTSIIVPDKNGDFENITLGFDDLQSYQDGHPYFGALVGRYGNRIALGEFELDGETYTLAKNNGVNHLHGGIIGFDKKIWEAETFNNDAEVGIKLHYLSPDMEEGFPGNLDVNVVYTLTNENELKIDYKATIDKACPINLTYHGYFNLTGGERDVLSHELMMNADKYVVVDENLIPTGELRDVGDTPMEFSDYVSIGDRIDQTDGGYDHSYVLNKEGDELSLVAKVYEPESARLMEVWTTEPGVQLYTGNFLDGTLTGKDGVVYNKQYGFCLEAQHYPDSPNQPEFPNSILRPGEEYTQTTVYKFSVK